MKAKYKKVIEYLGWQIREYDDCIDICQMSPAGEDFYFTVGKDNFVKEVREYADNFDADEHAEMWVQARGKVEGVPQSIRVLIEDADTIKEMLDALARTLERVQSATKKGV